MDLCERVVAAVEAGGLCCHRAAAQFGMGVNTSIGHQLVEQAHDRFAEILRFGATPGVMARPRWKVRLGLVFGNR